MSLHRIIALMFIPNKYNKPIVDHIDTDTLNNCKNNLRWVSQKENMNNINSKIKINKPVDQIDKNTNKIINTFPSIKDAKKYMNDNYGFSSLKISDVCNKKKHFKTAGGFKWEFCNIHDLNNTHNIAKEDSLCDVIVITIAHSHISSYKNMCKYIIDELRKFNYDINQNVINTFDIKSIV